MPSSLSDLESKSHFMDRSRLASEVSLPDRLLKFRLQRKNNYSSSVLGAGSEGGILLTVLIETPS